MEPIQTTLIERAWSPLVDLEIRGGGDGRTVHGLAVPFDSPTEIRDAQGTYTEVFKQGAFAKTINDGINRVKFLVNHERTGRLPIGRAVNLVEDPSGLVGEFKVSATRDGDEVLELIRDGVLDSLSIGFRPIRDEWNKSRTFVERIEAALPEVSTVAFPAYADAQISGVRAGQHPVGDADQSDAALVGTSDGHLVDSAAYMTVRQARLRLAQLKLEAQQ